TFVGWSGACSGSGSACTLAANQAHAALAHFKVPVTGLSRGQATADLSAQGGLARMYSLHVPSGSESLRIRLSGGSGDADLYVRHGTEPNESQYDCRPYLHGNNELCEFPAPLAGIYYIMIKGAPDYSGARLFAHYALGPQGGRTVSADVPMTGISAPQGGGRYFKVDVPQGATDLWITTRASRDLDLFVRRGGVPTPDWNEQFVSGNPAGNEEIYIPNPQRGMHYILLHAYESFSGASLRAGYTVAGKRIVMTHSGLGAGTVAMRRVATGATAATCAGFPCTVGLPDATFDLIASPSTGSAFSGWIASQCDSITPQGDCRMRVSSERPVSVGFSGAPSKPVVTLNTVGEGSGVVLVRAAGGDAPLAVCTAFPCRIAPTATTYELVPIAAPDSAFTRWISPTMGTPACASITAEGYCRLQPTVATSVTANFVK
ncbi:MAG TPA: PPC domain-containing protein, partial [Chiayiivirga sp.]|nr:PPC domain-containing protein [Chiayiivirga sp.]